MGLPYTSTGVGGVKAHLYDVDVPAGTLGARLAAVVGGGIRSLDDHGCLYGTAEPTQLTRHATLQRRKRAGRAWRAAEVAVARVGTPAHDMTIQKRHYWVTTGGLLCASEALCAEEK